MVRKCSHCGNIGHNSRTCNKVGKGNNNATNGSCGGIRLFGVHLDIASSSSTPIKKSFSLDCLSPSSSSSSSSLSSSTLSHIQIPSTTSNGYLSDDPFGRATEKRKGVPWSAEEHRTFLMGLEKLGKGDWRGISRKYVKSRTPTQVASHAQKYFLRQNNANNNSNNQNQSKKRRASLFDMEVVGACKKGGSKSTAALKRREAEIDLNSVKEEGEEFAMQKLIKSPENDELELRLSSSSGQRVMLINNVQNDQSSSSPCSTSLLIGPPISVT